MSGKSLKKFSTFLDVQNMSAVKEEQEIDSLEQLVKKFLPNLFQIIICIQAKHKLEQSSIVEGKKKIEAI